MSPVRLRSPRSDRPRTPESVAVTGGVEPGAEAPPVVRGRLASGNAAIALLLLSGFALLAVAPFIEDETAALVGTMSAGLGVVVLAVTAGAGVLPLRLAAALGVALGTLLIVSAYLPATAGAGEWMRMTVGAVAALASFGLLFSLARGLDASDDPPPRVESS